MYYFTSLIKPEIFCFEENENINDILYYFPLMKVEKGQKFYYAELQDKFFSSKELFRWDDYLLGNKCVKLNFEDLRGVGNFFLKFKCKRDFYIIDFTKIKNFFSGRVTNFESEIISEMRKKYSLYFNDDQKIPFPEFSQKIFGKKRNAFKCILGCPFGKNKFIYIPDFIKNNNVIGIYSKNNIYINSKMMGELFELKKIETQILGIQNLILENNQTLIRNYNNFPKKLNPKTKKLTKEKIKKRKEKFILKINSLYNN